MEHFFETLNFEKVKIALIYEAPETSSRTDGILNCYEWLMNNNIIY